MSTLFCLVAYFLEMVCDRKHFGCPTVLNGVILENICKVQLQFCF